MRFLTFAVLAITVGALSQPSFPAPGQAPSPTNIAPVISNFGVDQTPMVSQVPAWFVASAFDPDGDSLRYTIHFGDGGTFSAMALSGELVWATHAYAAPGTPRVVLDVDDSRGGSATAALDWLVLERAFLRLTTSIDIHPEQGVPGTISTSSSQCFAGYAANAWGLDWVKLPTWAQNVWFSDVPGYATPSCKHMGPFGPGSTTEYSAVYRALGWLRVVTDPPLPGTIFVADVPRNDWGMWTALQPGTYKVSFGPVAGYLAPDPQIVVVEPESTTFVTGRYIIDEASPGPDPASFGMLRVVTRRGDGLVGVPSQVWIDGIVRDDWGLNWVKLPPGCYALSFSNLPGLEKPPDLTTCVTARETREVMATFDVLGFLRVATDPPVAATITVGLSTERSSPRNDWGLWVALPAGEYRVAFGYVPGFTAPQGQLVSVRPGETTWVTGSFAPAS